jgi:hypothetical protein
VGAVHVCVGGSGPLDEVLSGSTVADASQVRVLRASAVQCSRPTLLLLRQLITHPNNLRAAGAWNEMHHVVHLGPSDRICAAAPTRMHPRVGALLVKVREQDNLRQAQVLQRALVLLEVGLVQTTSLLS